MLTCVMIGTFLTCNGEPIGNIYMRQRETTYIQAAPRTQDYSAHSQSICENRRWQSEMFQVTMAAFAHCKAYTNGKAQ